MAWGVAEGCREVWMVWEGCLEVVVLCLRRDEVAGVVLWRVGPGDVVVVLGVQLEDVVVVELWVGPGDGVVGVCRVVWR